jgi:hypothetical protein
MLAPLKMDDIFLCLTCLPLTFVTVAPKSEGLMLPCNPLNLELDQWQA